MQMGPTAEASVHQCSSEGKDSVPTAIGEGGAIFRLKRLECALRDNEEILTTIERIETSTNNASGTLVQRVDAIINENKWQKADVDLISCGTGVCAQEEKHGIDPGELVGKQPEALAKSFPLRAIGQEQLGL